MKRRDWGASEASTAPAGAANRATQSNQKIKSVNRTMSNGLVKRARWPSTGFYPGKHGCAGQGKT